MKLNPTRRWLLGLVPVSALLQFPPGTAHAAAAPILLDMRGISDVRELVDAMRAAAPRLRRSPSNDVFYREFARTAFDHARDAVQRNIPVPDFLLDRLPTRKVSMMPVASVPIMVMLRIFGVTFAVPLATYFSIDIGSVWLLYLFLSAEREKRYGPKEPALVTPGPRTPTTRT